MKHSRVYVVILFCLVFITILVGCKSKAASLSQEGDEVVGIQITSNAFNEGDRIPRIYTCDNKNISPPLEWTGVPSDTVSLALIMDDPDASMGAWVHWVLYNLPPSMSGLEQGKEGSGTEGKNDFNHLGYGGPCPPIGSNHRYYIKIYALDTLLDLKSGASKDQVESAMRGHILGQGQLMGRCGR
jgi:Raf kinase inhibitor-like YbhB/YbcL family protein